MDPQIAEHNRNVNCTAMAKLTTAIVIIIILVDPFVAPIYMAVS